KRGKDGKEGSRGSTGTKGLKGKSGDLCKLTPHTIAKISEYCKKWIDLDGEQSTIAANIAERIKRWSFHSETELVRDEIARKLQTCDITKSAMFVFVIKQKSKEPRKE
ncbi:Hypothetical predicted protein, partial [Paramuricea clavata]